MDLDAALVDDLLDQVEAYQVSYCLQLRAKADPALTAMATRHTLMASVLDVGGTLVNKQAVLQPGAAAAWGDLREDGEVPMPLHDQPAEEVLAEFAAALRQTDMLWPRNDDEDFIEVFTKVSVP